MSELFSAHGLSVRYGVARAVENVELAVPEKGVVALLGANGAGKSSTLKAIAGLVAAEGELRFAGEDIGALAARQRVRRGIVYVPEGRQIVGALTVAENLLLGGFFLDAQTQRQRRDLMLELFPEIAGRLKSPAWMLSGGEQQMLAIGRGLMSAPRLLLLDEPLGALDERRRAEILPYLVRLRDEARIPMVYVSHDAAEMRQLATQIVLLHRGRVSSFGGVKVLPGAS